MSADEIADLAESQRLVAAARGGIAREQHGAARALELEATAVEGGDGRFEKERQLDVEVGGADEAHDACLASPAERRDAHGVDDEQHRDDEHGDGDD